MGNLSGMQTLPLYNVHIILLLYFFDFKLFWFDHFFFQGIPDLPAEVAAEPAESAEPQEHGEQPQGEGGDKTPVSGSLLNN